MSRKRKATRQPNLPESYGFEVLEIQPDYGFSAKTFDFDPGPYRETLVLRLRLRCLIPSKHLDTEVSGYLYGRPKAEFMNERDDPDRTRILGELEIGKRRNAITGFFPTESAWGILGSLDSGIARFLIVTADRLYRARASIHSFDFTSQFDPEEW